MSVRGPGLVSMSTPKSKRATTSIVQLGLVSLGRERSCLAVFDQLRFVYIENNAVVVFTINARFVLIIIGPDSLCCGLAVRLANPETTNKNRSIGPEVNIPSLVYI